ncbi:cytochrome P450 [Panaeolus papilionaceus]|nr:cytochrome P450 [Panaeolus papilionaceus]
MALLSTLAEYPYHSLVFTFLICTTLKTVFTRKRRNPNGLPLPPGPKGLPIIGNLLDVPQDKPWLGYNDWCKVYGDMVYFEVLGQPFIVLGSLEKTNDLFEKRSSNYSDRMRMPMVLELMHWDYNMALLPYGQWWRRHRRAFHEHFHPGVVAKHQPVQIYETRAFLQRLLETPDNFLHHVRHTFAATIMRVAYGITVKESGDPYITNAEQALYGLAEAGIPGSFLVDLIPALKYIPEWFPGATFQKKATRWRNINKDVALKPFEHVKEQMKAGVAVPESVASYLIERLPDENHPLRKEEEKIAQDTAAVAYVGGADTTVSAVQTFFLAMVMYPEVMKKAQAELDAVIGPHRLPDYSDRPSLTYINAMVKESMRWQMIIPLAVGHMATEDDEYNGYFIPKGTVLMGNAWSILHDPEVFDEPEEYIPERYIGKDGKLDPNARNPSVAAFGYGRRICPGRHMSDNALFMIIASTLAVFDIRAPLDKTGKPIKPKAEFTSGLLSYPVPFECRITPRSSTAKRLVQDGLDHL